MTGAPAERSPLPLAALGLAAAAALSAWNPLSAPFGLAVGLATVGLGVRALVTGRSRWASIVQIDRQGAVDRIVTLVLALTAGVGRDLGGQPVVAVPPGVAKKDLDAAAERTRASRERARQELDALEPPGGKPAGPPGQGKGGTKDASPPSR